MVPLLIPINPRYTLAAGFKFENETDMFLTVNPLPSRIPVNGVPFIPPIGLIDAPSKSMSFIRMYLPSNE